MPAPREDGTQTRRLHLSKNGALDVEFAESETLALYEQLAQEALEECRKSLMMALRYLNTALWHMPSERALLTHPLATNGRSLRFDPDRVVQRYRAGEGELARDLLHVVLHCVFHHPFEKRYGEHAAWSLASDVAVELCAIELCGERFPSALDARRLEAAARLARLARNLTAPALYQVFRCGPPGEALYRDQGLSERDLDELSYLFKRDAHDLWATHPGEGGRANEARAYAEPVPDLLADQGASSAGKPANDQAASGNANKADAESAEHAAADAQRSSGERGSDDLQPEQLDAADEQAASEWTRISKQVEAEARAQYHGTSGEGGLMQNLAVANRKPADYDEFLRRFATIAEDLHVSDEEFDYVYYTYGLSRYGNIPLVEPLEYQESKRVREFVIALDTSGSCAGDLIRTFVERTYAVLRQQTSFGHDINVHLVQCDNRIRSATKVTSLAQLERFADSFWVSGGGGTDFRPVFDYVDQLVDDGEFNDLRGLIYFTDGYGTFPTRAPAYDVAFVFVDADEANVRVPGWAMKVTMTQEEVLDQQKGHP